jgi:hypothetical protein
MDKQILLSSPKTQHFILLFGLVALVGQLACVDLLTAGFPNQNRISVGDTIVGRLGSVGEIDSYIIEREDTVLIAAFLRALEDAAESPVLTVATREVQPTRKATVTGVGPADALHSKGSGPFTLYAEALAVEVSGDYVGDYEFQLFPLDVTPETGSPELSLNSAVSDAIDPPGDIDLYDLAPTDAQIYAVLCTSASSTVDGIRLEVVEDPVGMAVAEVLALPGDTSVTPLVSPGGHQLYLRVSGSNENTATGPYRLSVGATDSEPEEWGATITPGDTAIESLSPFNDIDEFQITVPSGIDWMNVFAGSINGVPFGGITVSVVGPGDVAVVPPTPASVGDTTLWHFGVGRFHVSPGTLTIRVQGETSAAVGSYRLLPVLISEEPELTPHVLTPGDTLYETIDPVGDVDRFALAGTPGAGQDVVFGLLDDGVDPLDVIIATSSTHADILGWSSDAGALKLFVLGDHLTALDPPAELIVNSDWRNVTHRFRGDYFLVAFEHNPQPEAVASTISIGQTVTGEAISPAGDSDIFKFPADSGQLLGLVFTSSSPASEDHLRAWLLRRTPSVWAIQTAYSRGGVTDSTGVVQVESTDTLDVEIGTNNVGTMAQGAYQFRVYEVSVGPEHVPASIAIGDTLVGESLDPIGDLDEYQLNLTAGDEFQVVVTQAVHDTELAGYIGVWVVDPAGNTVIGAAAFDGRQARTGTVVAEHTGTYVLRVKSGSGLPMYSGGYTISVSPST